LFFKLPEPLKKKPNTILTTSVCTMKQSLQGSTDLLERNPVRRLILKDLTVRSDSDVQGL
jgi:hypothetical protein